jgi:para-aminobenzoate synthetase / 4-amino-4-deoxychorismate lyase
MPPHPTVRIVIDFPSPRKSTPSLRAAFEHPVEIIATNLTSTVTDVLKAVESRAKAGYWCVGFVEYEAASAFDSALQTHGPSESPVTWFAVFDCMHSLTESGGGTASVEWDTVFKKEETDAAIIDIHRFIAAGDVYQVNYTGRMHGTLRAGDPFDLFSSLQRAQPTTFAAYIDTGIQKVLSVSPELFFDWQSDRSILARPMKGTAPRGATTTEDEENAVRLRASPKERAENLMIVDLIRNDLSRIGELGSVKVERLFHAEALPTVWSMTSDITARTRPEVGLSDVFSSLFPCGSITGAPKIRAMQLITELEPERRGVYCGAVGVVRPGGAATFNVPIRTLEIRQGTNVSCGIGSGITIDADIAGEWREWQCKAAFVHRASQSFALVENLRIDDGVAYRLKDHIERLATTAEHFGFVYNAHQTADTISGLCSKYPNGLYCIALHLHADGKIETVVSILDTGPDYYQAQLATKPFEAAHSEFVRYKTTRRQHYDMFCPSSGFHDTLLWNEDEEITEFTNGSVFVKLDGMWVTPPLSCGLSSGIERKHILSQGRAVERVVKLRELKRAAGIASVNSVRGWVDVRLQLPE